MYNRAWNNAGYCYQLLLFLVSPSGEQRLWYLPYQLSLTCRKPGPLLPFPVTSRESQVRNPMQHGDLHPSLYISATALPRRSLVS